MTSSFLKIAPHPPSQLQSLFIPPTQPSLPMSPWTCPHTAFHSTLFLGLDAPPPQPLTAQLQVCASIHAFTGSHPWGTKQNHKTTPKWPRLSSLSPCSVFCPHFEMGLACVGVGGSVCVLSHVCVFVSVCLCLMCVSLYKCVCVSVCVTVSYVYVCVLALPLKC